MAVNRPDGSEMSRLSISAGICLLGWLLHTALPIGIPGVLEIGPADIFVKTTESCGFTLPTFIDCHIRLIRVRGKQVMNVTGTVPFKISDKLGVEIACAQKKAGQWRPNFFKAKGAGVCSALKNAEKDIFDILAKGLNAPEPYACPLPPGGVAIIDYPLSLRKFQKLLGAETMPYGEYKVSLNLTHKSDVIACTVFYVDVVPRTGKKG